MRISDWSSDVCSSDLLVAMEGVLALGLADSLAGARTLARSSLCEGFGAVRRSFSADWEAWATDLTIADAPDDVRREAYLSAVVRSEEHPSELQSLMRISYAVFCLKKQKIRLHYFIIHSLSILY